MSQDGVELTDGGPSVRRSHRTAWVVLGAVAVGLVLGAAVVAGVAYWPHGQVAPAHHQLTGSVESPITSYYDKRYPTNYDFGLHEGAPVAVYGANGELLGSGFLSDSHRINIEGISDMYRLESTFTVDVPDAPFYQVEVGSHGRLTYAHAVMVAQNWSVSMSMSS